MRQMGMFPFYEDMVPAPRADGTLASVPTGRDVSILQSQGEAPDIDRLNIIVQGNIGDTDYVECHQVQYGVFAGNS